MQKAVNTSSVLSIVHSSSTATEQIEAHLFLLSEKNKIKRNAASHLHRLFFGKYTTEILQTVATEKKADEPDYFSSYE